MSELPQVESAHDLGFTLHADDREALDSLRTSLQPAPLMNGYTISAVVRIWRELAHSVNERGWNANEYDGAGLSWRDTLEAILHECPERLAPRLRSAVAEIDAVFAEATELDVWAIRHGHHMRPDKQAWWWTCIPRSGPIREDLERFRGR